jgi:RING finger protein 113A
LHDRGDYKSGWQLEREWESEQTKKKKKMEDSIAGFGDEDVKPTEGEEDDDDKYAIDSDEEDLPFACFICREDFTNPVMTVCGHYFCAQCAMEGTKGTGNKCPICNKQTFGVFNRAHKLLKKIAAKKGITETDQSESSASISVAGSKNVSAMIAPIRKRGNWESVDN